MGNKFKPTPKAILKNPLEQKQEENGLVTIKVLRHVIERGRLKYAPGVHTMKADEAKILISKKYAVNIENQKETATITQTETR